MRVSFRTHRDDTDELINRRKDPKYQEIREELLPNLFRCGSCPPLLHGLLQDGMRPSDVPGLIHEKRSPIHEQIDSGVPWSKIQASLGNADPSHRTKRLSDFVRGNSQEPYSAGIP